MSGAWYALAAVAIALVVRWYIRNDTGAMGGKESQTRRGWRAPDFSKSSSDLD
jgi:hypothetical protein